MRHREGHRRLYGGHHCFIEAGDELFCLYHCFYNPTNNYDPDGNFLGRAIGVDKITFQTYDQKTYNYFKNKQIALDLDTYDSLKNGTASSAVRSRNGGIAGFESRDKFESFIREAFDTANGQHYENRNDPDTVVPIMYCNGPTYALQPLPDVTLPNGYTNIAPSATVTILEGDTDSAKYLNDQMTAYQEWSAPWETSTDTGTLRFKLAWDKPMTIRNIMVYEPYDWYSAFRSVKSIVFKLAEKPVWYPSDLDYNGYCYIEDLKVDTDAWTRMLRMRHGHSAMATFNEITVTEIYVTIDKYDKIDYEMVQDTSDENSIRVSEVYVMGREA